MRKEGGRSFGKKNDKKDQNSSKKRSENKFKSSSDRNKDSESSGSKRPFKKFDDKKSSNPRSDSRFKSGSDRNSEDSNTERKPFRKFDDRKPSGTRSDSRFKSGSDRNSDDSNTERKPFRKFDENFDEKKTDYSRDSGKKAIKKFEKNSEERSRSDRSEPKKGSSNSIRKSLANDEMRLNKYIASTGLCSRREADEFITLGLVTVNDVVVTELGTKVKSSDAVKYDGRLLKSEKKIYILLNKPKDFVTTSDDPQGRKTVMDLVNNYGNERIYPVGRLDKMTTGVLLMTNDGELTKKLTHPKFNFKKIYHVHLDKVMTKEDLKKLMTGFELEDGFIQVDEAHFVNESDKKQIGVEIHSGRNRIVRRMFQHLGYRVDKLDRVYFAGLTKKGLARGQWKYLGEQELNMLKRGAF